MPTQLTLPAETRVGRQRVYAKLNWQNPWSYQPGLWSSGWEWASLPAIGAATLHWKVFRGTLQHETVSTYHDWLTLDRNFIKIEYERPTGGVLRWYGFIDMERQRRDDRLNAGAQKLTTGEQSIGVVGIEQVFADTPVVDGWFKDSQANPDPELPPITIARQICKAPTFNEDRKPNRSDVKVLSPFGYTSFVFSKYSQGASYWSTRDIIEYLFAFHYPKLGTGAPLVPAGILNANEAALFNWDKPELQSQGRYVRDLLSELIHARRGLGAYFIPADDPTLPWLLRPFTHSLTDVVLSAEDPNHKLLANPLQVNVAVDWGTSAERDGRPDLITVLDRRMESQFDRVVAMGAPRTSTFSTYFGAASAVVLNKWITSDWTDADLATYNAGGTGDADYSTSTPTEKRKLNHQARHDDKLAHVFARYKLGDNFSGFAGGDYIGLDQNQLFPVFDNPADPTKPISNWPLGWKFRKTLPITEGLDYTGTQFPQWPSQSSTQAERMPLAPMIFVQLASGKYVRVDVHGMAGVDDQDWSIDVDIEEFPPRIWLKVKQRPQHILGQGQFVALPDGLEVSPQYAWDQHLYGTICLEESRYALAAYPDPLPNAGLGINMLRTKIIDCGEQYRLDWIAGRTAVGIDSATGGLEWSGPAGGYARDDTNELFQIARSAYEFYRRARVSALIQKPGATPDLWLGMLIDKLGRTNDPASATSQLNTVVTSVAMSFPRGRALPTQSWTTSHAEIDGMEFLR